MFVDLGYIPITPFLKTYPTHSVPVRPICLCLHRGAALLSYSSLERDATVRQQKTGVYGSTTGRDREGCECYLVRSKRSDRRSGWCVYRGPNPEKAGEYKQ